MLILLAITFALIFNTTDRYARICNLKQNSIRTIFTLFSFLFHFADFIIFCDNFYFISL